MAINLGHAVGRISRDIDLVGRTMRRCRRPCAGHRASGRHDRISAARWSVSVPRCPVCGPFSLRCHRCWVRPLASQGPPAGRPPWTAVRRHPFAAWRERGRGAADQGEPGGAAKPGRDGAGVFRAARVGAALADPVDEDTNGAADRGQYPARRSGVLAAANPFDLAPCRGRHRRIDGAFRTAGGGPRCADAPSRSQRAGIRRDRQADRAAFRCRRALNRNQGQPGFPPRTGLVRHSNLRARRRASLGRSEPAYTAWRLHRDHRTVGRRQKHACRHIERACRTGGGSHGGRWDCDRRLQPSALAKPCRVARSATGAVRRDRAREPSLCRVQGKRR